MVQKITLEELGRRVKEWGNKAGLSELLGCNDNDNLQVLAKNFLTSWYSLELRDDNGNVIYITKLGDFEII